MQVGSDDIIRVQVSLKHGLKSSEMIKCEMQAQ